MEKPKNCEECQYYHTCRTYYMWLGCKYSEEEVRKNGENSNS